MDKQNQIKRTLSEQASIDYIRGLLQHNGTFTIGKLVERVCEQFEFYDARGRQQFAGCLKALRELETSGHFVLPAVRRKIGRKSPRRLYEPVAPATDVPAEVGEVRGLSLVMVETIQQMRIWNELMIGEHPQGAGPLVGRQLRYLIDSQHGWLGGFGFASAALQLADRDKWIGWDAEQRRGYLHTVVGMSRFLIRSCVQCHNLASKVLSMCMGRVADDFQRVYNYRPWLIESFVDTSRQRDVA